MSLILKNIYYAVRLVRNLFLKKMNHLFAISMEGPFYQKLAYSLCMRVP